MLHEHSNATCSPSVAIRKSRSGAPGIRLLSMYCFWLATMEYPAGETSTVTLGSITHNAPAFYASALDYQILGRYGKASPWWVIYVFFMLVELACCVAGRGHLSNIPGNFLPLMSYRVWPWVTIVIEKYLLSHSLRGLISDWIA